LPSEDGNLVTEHDDLNGQIGVIGPLQAEDLDGPEEGEIEEREGHGPFSRLLLLRRKSQFNYPDGILVTHTLRSSRQASAVQSPCFWSKSRHPPRNHG
jgi:hypothetical protein